MERFKNRSAAGKILAARLVSYQEQPQVLVLALPRGGVPVAYEVATALRAPMDVFIVRKLGVPGHEELAMGALTTGSIRVMNQEVIDNLQISAQVIEEVSRRELLELKRREEKYRRGHLPPPLQDQTIILIDDGLATGSSMRAAVRALSLHRPARLIVAVPVASPEICEKFKEEVDEVICLLTPEPFYAVGLWYKDFSQTTDEEVIDLLNQAQKERDSSLSPSPSL